MTLMIEIPHLQRCGQANNRHQRQPLTRYHVLGHDEPHMPEGTLRAILKQTGIDQETFLKQK